MSITCLTISTLHFRFLKTTTAKIIVTKMQKSCVHKTRVRKYKSNCAAQMRPSPQLGTHLEKKKKKNQCYMDCQ